jgi:hypothetical protein
MAMKRKNDMFELLNDNITIGRLKKRYAKTFFKRMKLIGRFDVDYLREFLKNLPKGEEPLYIGIYTMDGEIAPLHCKRWLLSPRKLEKKYADFDKLGEF